MTVAVLNAMLKPLLEARLPGWVEVQWYGSKEEACALAPRAEIGWFDMYAKADMAHTIEQATQLKWLNSVFAGVESFPLTLLSQRGVVLTNGAGINAVPIAEYVLMLMLVHAKGYRAVVHAQARREWLKESPGKRELFGSQVLILGYGAIGQEVETRLIAFGAQVTKVRRTAGPGTLGPDQWRAQLGTFDWIVIAVPATLDTLHMIGAAELAAMKHDAVVVNIARGSVIDQAALVTALEAGAIGGALLDVTTPEPLPSEHPLWALDNAQVTMHLSGNAQTLMFQRAAQNFLANLDRYHAGQPLTPQVDFTAGY